MLVELISALLSPASASARLLGHVHEGVAIQARYRRHRAAWDGHLRRCRQTVLEWVDRESVVRGAAGLRLAVLGSGSLLDVPLDDLVGRGLAVDLVDVFHPRSARKAVNRLGRGHSFGGGATLVEHDFLGLAKIADLADAPHRLGCWRDAVAGPPDLVLSCNLLSQLPLRPLDVWGRHVADPAAWSAAVMRAHLADLQAGPGRALLVSEYRHRWVDRAGRVVDEYDPLDGLVLPPPLTCWEWPLAPAGEIEKDRALVLSVGAFVMEGRRE